MRSSFKYFLAIAGLFSLAFSKLPNGKFPAGIYMSFTELKTKSPSRHCRLQAEARTKDAKLWVGGSDYKLSSPEKCISKYTLTNDAWAYADDSVMYVNCKQMKLEEFGWARVIISGRFLCFSNKELKDELGGAMAFGSFIGGFVGGAIAASVVSANKQPFDAIIYAVDMRSAKLFLVDSTYMQKALKDYPSLRFEFEKEFNKNDGAINLRYLQMANDAE